jgi:uncharacterized repeat protein (TIGR03803 family)
MHDHNKDRPDNSFLAASHTSHNALAFVFLAVFTLIATQPSQAQTFTVLHTFAGPTKDGGNPEAGLILDSTRNLYGTTASGGASDSGTVFRVTAAGKEMLLYSFGEAPTDGTQAVASLLRDSKGNLYGTTENGGASFAGTVFKLDKARKETLLFSFNGGTTGNNPVAGLVMDAKGNLYGTAESGGLGSFGNGGIVFKIDTAGHESTLYNFCSVTSCTDGWTPKAGLILWKGNLYGTTRAGGTHDFGTVFKLTPSGKETVLYSFGENTDDGFYPVAGLVPDSKGNFYGTTSAGGFGYGTVFKLTAARKENVLYPFTGHADGNMPLAGLVRDGNGNLYGTTENGGSDQVGVVFKLSPGGKETVLYNFTGKADGREPVAGLVLDRKGDLYGTTPSGGGSCFCGTVFKLTP